MIPAVKDIPYQGEFECHNRYVNGDEITIVGTGVTARDSVGRTVVQYDSNPMAAFLPFVFAVIFDPAEQMAYFVDRESSSTLASSPIPTESSEAPTSIDGLGVTSPTLFAALKPSDTFIGEKIIERIRCKGYRRSGRRREEIEFWVAEELQVAITNTTNWGGFESSFRVHNIRRGEPNPELLTIPPPDKSERIWDFYFSPL